MKKSKEYSHTIFTSSTISEALSELGKYKLTETSITANEVTTDYDSIEAFYKDYNTFASIILMTATGNNSSLSLFIYSHNTTINITAPENSIMNRILTIFEQASTSPGKSVFLPPFQVERRCVATSLNWETLEQIPSVVGKYGIICHLDEVTISRYPDRYTYSDLVPALRNVREKGEPVRYTISYTGQSDCGNFSLIIDKGYYPQGDQYLAIKCIGLSDIIIFDKIVNFLGLKPEVIQYAPRLERTAFIAHRFDAHGQLLADKLARFLELLKFDVKTGRGFSPESVSEKVKKRIESQAIIFVLLTPGEDTTWLTQEAIIGHITSKLLFVLRDNNVVYKPGVLGDQEWIPFDTPNIESTFIHLLEGLREHGYLDFGEE